MTSEPAVKIGPVTVSPPVFVAPMAGYTDTVFRSICMRMGAGMCFTEVANAESLTRGSKATFHLLRASEPERPIAAHIYGREPDAMARAAAAIEKLGGFDVIDVNCGCPVRKVVAKGCGAAQMRNPEKIEAIVRAIRAGVSMPVTVKTRIGYERDKTRMLDIARAVEAGGACAIFVHARFAVDRHSGPADWDALAEIKRNLKIPVIGNGGVAMAEDVPAMIGQTGVDGVMIGRAAVGNPWIFAQARALLAGTSCAAPSFEQRRAVILEHLEGLIGLKAEERKHRRRASLSIEHSAVLHFRGHLFRYLHGLRGFTRIKRTFQTLQTVASVRAAVEELLFEQESESHLHSGPVC